MSYARFLAGDRFGNVLAELQPDIGSISWRLNNIGKVPFSLAISDGKATEDNLQYGNKVLIQFDNGLPDWGGVIDPNRDWEQGKVFCNAYSGEQLFKYRITDKNKVFSGSAAGDIFRDLVQEAVGTANMGLVLGSVSSGGQLHSPEYHYQILADIIQNDLTEKLAVRDFDVLATLEDNQIVLTANFYQRKGTYKYGVALVQGQNANISLSEQGPIVTSWTAAGAGQDWGDARLTSVAQDADSISKYGLREQAKVYSDVADQDTLDENSANLLSEQGGPYRIFDVTASNNPPAYFADYDIGDVVTLSAHDLGFGGTETSVRILAREFYPGSGVCSLVVEEET